MGNFVESFEGWRWFDGRGIGEYLGWSSNATATWFRGHDDMELGCHL